MGKQVAVEEIVDFVVQGEIRHIELIRDVSNFLVAIHKKLPPGKIRESVKEMGTRVSVYGLMHEMKRLELFEKNKGKDMPLVKGKAAKSKKGISENIRREVDSGKNVKQAAAIAYSVAGKSKKKAKK